MFGNWGSGTQVDGGGVKAKTFGDYDELVRRGFDEGERARMAEAYLNLRYATGHYDLCPDSYGLVRTSETWDARPPGDSAYERFDYSLAQPVAQRVVGKLCEHLYKRAPTRAVADKKVNAVLQEVYKRNAMGPKWQRADEFTAIAGFSAFQFAGGDDPKAPAKVHLWSADQLAVWTAPEDHARIEAVCTLDKVDGRTRAVLYTEETVAYYTTRRDERPGGVTRTFDFLCKVDNPYRRADDAETSDQGRGIVPFSFNHFEYPATEFTTDAPGSNLRELNRYVNHGFNDLGDGVRYLAKPIGVATGVDESWEAPARIRPGMFLNLAAGAVDAGGNGPEPALSYLQAPSEFVATIWSHLNNHLDLSLEMVGVPPSAVRMVLDARSGVSILAEQAPLLGWTERRRRLFADYELRAVVALFEVLAAHVRGHGLDSKRFDAAARDPGFSLRWPRLYVDLPGPERDRADGVRLTWGTASLFDLVMERDDCTREQALEHLTRVKKDADELTALGIDPVPAVLQPKPAAVGYGGFAQAQDQIASGPDPAQGGPQSGVAGEPVDASTKADALSQEGG